VAGRRILLGDGTGGGTVVMRPIRFRCVGVRISGGLPCVDIYVYLRVATQNLAFLSYWYRKETFADALLTGIVS
jgi:hypothetical protein